MVTEAGSQRSKDSRAQTQMRTDTADEPLLTHKPLSCELLMALPRDWLATLFRDFLTLTEVARLDGAMVSRPGRAKLLDVLGSGSVWFEKGEENKWDYIKKECLIWLGKRGVGVKRLKCNGQNKYGLTADMVVTVCKNSPGLLFLRLEDWNLAGYSSFLANELAEVARHCLQVETLQFFCCNDFSDVTVEAARNMHNLRDVRFSNCSDPGDAALVALSEHCHGIVKADFESCRRITDQGVARLADACPLIEDINLWFCIKVTDVGITALAKGCRSLRSLNIRGLKQITDGAVKLLAEHCPSLQVINLNLCMKLTDEAIKHLAKHCPELTDIDLGGCNKVTDESLDKLAECCPKLKKVIVEKTHVTNAARERMKRRLPKVTFN